MVVERGRSLQRNGTSLFWHSMEISRNLVYPTMFQKAKGVTGFLAEMSEKAGPLNAMAYAISRGVGAREKRGVPKNAGISDDMYENKGQKNSDRGYPTIYMKTGNLTVLSDDMDENKPLNTRSALAQRAMLSGSIVCSPRREFTSRNGGLKLPLRGRHYGRPTGRAQLWDSSLSPTNIAEFHSALAGVGEPATDN